MPINKKLIFFKKRQHYDNEINNGLSPTAINFIDETKEIITHGSVFAGLYNVQQSTSIPDFSLSKTWAQYPLDLHSILNGTGTYIIQITYGSAIYSGIMTYFDDTSADIDEEIPLHVGGTFFRPDVSEQKEGRLYAKIKASESSTISTYPSLFLASSLVETNADAHISAIKFRKLI